MAIPRWKANVAWGSPLSERSTTWRFMAHGEQVYAFVDGAGGKFKFSFHADGNSFVGYVSAEEAEAGARGVQVRHGRYLRQWRRSEPEGWTHQELLKVLIPHWALRWRLTHPANISRTLWIRPLPGPQEYGIMTLMLLAPDVDAVLPTGTAAVHGTTLPSGKRVGVTASLVPLLEENIEQWRAGEDLVEGLVPHLERGLTDEASVIALGLDAVPPYCVEMPVPDALPAGGADWIYSRDAWVTLEAKKTDGAQDGTP